MIDPKYEKALILTFHDLHGCEASHIGTVPVLECERGRIIWEGHVEIFALYGHPTAKKGFAWAYRKGKGSKVVAVLELPPVISPKTAVQASLV